MLSLGPGQRMGYQRFSVARQQGRPGNLTPHTARRLLMHRHSCVRSSGTWQGQHWDTGHAWCSRHPGQLPASGCRGTPPLCRPSGRSQPPAWAEAVASVGLRAGTRSQVVGWRTHGHCASLGRPVLVMDGTPQTPHAHPNPTFNPPPPGPMHTLCRCQDGEAPLPSCPTASRCSSPSAGLVKVKLSTAPRANEVGVPCTGQGRWQAGGGWSEKTTALY